MMIKKSCNKKAVTLIIIVIFIAIAGAIGVTLAMLLSAEFQSATKNYNVELAFYAADSGVARGKKIIKDCPGWRPDPSACSGCSAPDYCSILATTTDAGGNWYMEETVDVPRTGGKQLYYRIYVTDNAGDIELVVDSGIKIQASP